MQGATLLLLGALWVLESAAAGAGAAGVRDQLRTGLVLGSLFGAAWLVAGNVWSARPRPRRAGVSACAPARPPARACAGVSVCARGRLARV